MARLRTAMDTEFWDVEVATPRLFDGVAKSVAGESFPMDGARSSRAFRFQQLSFLRNGFPLGLVPSYSPTFSNESPSLALQSLFLKPLTPNWWVGLIGQFRPTQLFSSIKSEFSKENAQAPSVKDVAKHFVDKSFFSLGLSTQYTPIPSTSIKWTTEMHGEKEGKRHKLMLFHQLPEHDITVEAAWPQLFIDSKGQYWDVPESLSMDIFSVNPQSPLQYRLGLHKNSSHPVAVNSTSHSDGPASLMPGVWAKAAVSYEKSMDFWRREEQPEDLVRKTNKGLFRAPSYDRRLNEPHAAISGIIGGNFAASFSGESSVTEAEGRDRIPVSTPKRSPFGADLFGSVCYTYQLGSFRNYFNDLTRFDARLDISSASALAKRVFKGEKDSATSPKLNLIFQQQVAGAVIARIDSRVSLNSAPGKKGLHMEDVLLSLSYSFIPFQSGKAVIWYSPKRKEGMVEFRLFEF